MFVRRKEPTLNYYKSPPLHGEVKFKPTPSDHSQCVTHLKLYLKKG